MKLSSHHMEMISKKLEWFSQPAQCAVCQSTEWNVSDTIIDLTEIQGITTYRKSGNTYPAIPIICRTCGNILLLNAIILGIIDAKTGKLVAVPAEVSGG